MFHKPEKLAKGDRVGIFLPSSPIRSSFRTKGLAAVRALGYEPVEVEGVLERRGFLARDPQRGVRDILDFFADPSIKALWAGRGGYGSNLLLPHLLPLSPPAPKVVIGSSDVSCLLWFLLDRWRMVVFYGPMVFSTMAQGAVVWSHLERMLTGRYREIAIRGQVWMPGRAKGIVTGGCLSNLVSLIGTPFMPRTAGRILLLEDVGERPYRLDRMLWQLFACGLFRDIRGLLLGTFPGCFKNRDEKVRFVDRVRDFLPRRRIPVIGSLSIGHARRASILPLGIEVELDTDTYPGVLIHQKAVLG